MSPFEKHILFWDSEHSPAKDGSTRVALHADEGFTHGDSACAGRGLDFRYFWDSTTFEVVAALRYSMHAVGGWSSVDDETSAPWKSTLVHGGLIEAVMDELTAEVMKINVCPEMVTSEFTVKLKKPSMPGVTYRASAKITEVSPPIVRIEGTIVNPAGEVVVQAFVKCAMMDKLLLPKEISQDKKKDREDGTSLTHAECVAGSSRLQLEAPAGGGASETGGAPGGDIGATMQELQRLQGQLVKLLQAEYFADDLEAPAGALGWEEGRLRTYFENGGE